MMMMMMIQMEEPRSNTYDGETKMEEPRSSTYDDDTNGRATV